MTNGSKSLHHRLPVQPNWQNTLRDTSKETNAGASLFNKDTPNQSSQRKEILPFVELGKKKKIHLLAVVLQLQYLQPTSGLRKSLGAGDASSGTRSRSLTARFSHTRNTSTAASSAPGVPPASPPASRPRRHSSSALPTAAQQPPCPPEQPGRRGHRGAGRGRGWGGKPGGRSAGGLNNGPRAREGKGQGGAKPGRYRQRLPRPAHPRARRFRPPPLESRPPLATCLQSTPSRDSPPPGCLATARAHTRRGSGPWRRGPGSPAGGGSGWPVSGAPPAGSGTGAGGSAEAAAAPAALGSGRL